MTTYAIVLREDTTYLVEAECLMEAMRKFIEDEVDRKAHSCSSDIHKCYEVENQSCKS